MRGPWVARTKASIEALKGIPQLNASLSGKGPTGWAGRVATRPRGGGGPPFTQLVAAAQTSNTASLAFRDQTLRLSILRRL